MQTPRTLLRLISAIAVAITTASTLSGCGILFGNVKPVEDKSPDYGVEDLSRTDPTWKKLDALDVQNAEDSSDAASGQPGDSTPPPVSDVAFQSSKTASIISLNSMCRASGIRLERDLKTFTEQLFLGMTQITERTDENLSIENELALQTTLRGTLDGRDVRMRTIVLKKNNCIYDLMLVAQPSTFSTDETTFQRFVTSLRLRDSAQAR